MTRVIAIVEGHGEVEAVPILFRRIAAVISPSSPPSVLPPFRVGRKKLLKEGELERAVELAARRVGPTNCILILLDADQDCPAELAGRLLERAVKQRSDRHIGVVLAKVEYEAWFLAAAESLRGLRELHDEIEPPEDPEAVRDAKGWLNQRMSGDHSYRETLDQPALTASFDLDRARERSPSFDKLWRELERMLVAEPPKGSQQQ